MRKTREQQAQGWTGSRGGSMPLFMVWTPLAPGERVLIHKSNFLANGGLNNPKGFQ